VSTRKKLLEKLSSFASDAGWTADEVFTLLAHHGFTTDSGKGSHQVFFNPARPEVRFVLAVHGKKIKSGYIRELRRLLAGE